MMPLRLATAVLLVIMAFDVCTSDDSKDISDDSKDVSDDTKESEEHNSDKKSLEDTFEESMKGFNNWFKRAGEGLKDKSESGVEAFKGFSEEAKEKSESGVEAMKGFTGGIGDRFSKVKEKIEESGEKMKEAIGNAALNTKEEFETAASKISNHAKEAGDSMMRLFG